MRICAQTAIGSWPCLDLACVMGLEVVGAEVKFVPDLSKRFHHLAPLLDIISEEEAQ